MKIPMTIAIVAAAGWASTAGASSPDAWAQFDRDVARRCAAASKLDHPRVSTIVGFDDTLGKVAALVTGREAVRRGGPDVTSRKLCIVDKRSRRVWIDEAQGWSAPARR